MTMPESARPKRIGVNGQGALQINHGKTVSMADEVQIYLDDVLVATVFKSGLIETRCEVLMITRSRNASPEGATP